METEIARLLTKILKKELAPASLTRDYMFYRGRNHGINRAIYIIKEWSKDRKVKPSIFNPKRNATR